MLAMSLGLTILLSICVQAVEKAESPCKQIDIAQVEVPADFLIEYQSERLLQGNVDYLEVNSEGNVIISKRENHEARKQVIKKYKIVKPRIKTIYAKVLACDFFHMQDYYCADPQIEDGGVDCLEVTAKGEKRRVIVRNSVPKFDASVQVLKAETAQARAKEGWLSNLWKKLTTKVSKEN